MSTLAIQIIDGAKEVQMRWFPKYPDTRSHSPCVEFENVPVINGDYVAAVKRMLNATDGRVNYMMGYRGNTPVKVLHQVWKATGLADLDVGSWFGCGLSPKQIEISTNIGFENLAEWIKMIGKLGTSKKQWFSVSPLDQEIAARDYWGMSYNRMYYEEY